jgi:TM2 domain-containing membrane protein YozV
VNYYVADGTTQRGPFSEQELPGAGLRPDVLVWREGMPQWLPAEQVAELRPFLMAQAGPSQYGPAGAAPMGYPPPGPMAVGYATPTYLAYPLPSDISGKKIAAGICGIFFGTFGVHKFILGLTGGAVTMLVISLSGLVLGAFTCGMTWMVVPVMYVIGLVEGILYLTKSDAEFYHLYMVQRRQWF